MIPSSSWGYTAGNQYRLNHVLGSLTLGGYDSSKFLPNSLTWSFHTEDIRDLTVEIESITISDSTKTSQLLPSPIPAYLDSSLPYIWLPLEACTLFEDVFGLSWDSDTQLYLVNSTQHDALLAQNASITFTLGNLTAGSSVDITLPYAAFDLTAEYPLVANSTTYFPLKRAANETQYTLGRAFFQEAYVIADYERRTFSVSQCKWEANSQQNIVPITPPSSEQASTKSHHLSHGSIAGIVCAIILSITTIILYSVYILLRHRRRRAAAATAATAAAAATLAEKTKPLAPEPPDPLFMKPELETREPQPVFEMEEKRNQWVVETDGKEVVVHELPAREEVAAEVMGLREPVELESLVKR